MTSRPSKPDKEKVPVKPPRKAKRGKTARKRRARKRTETAIPAMEQHITSPIYGDLWPKDAPLSEVFGPWKAICSADYEPDQEAADQEVVHIFSPPPGGPMSIGALSGRLDAVSLSGNAEPIQFSGADMEVEPVAISSLPAVPAEASSGPVLSKTAPAPAKPVVVTSPGTKLGTDSKPQSVAQDKGKYSIQDTRTATIRVPYYVPAEITSAITCGDPKVNLKVHVGEGVHDHGIPAWCRVTAETMAVKSVGPVPEGKTVVDIGGNPIRHYNRRKNKGEMVRQRIHSCCPILIPGDTMRERKRSQHVANGDALAYCNCSAEACTHHPNPWCYLSVFSVYYLTPETVLLLLRKCETHAIYIVAHLYDPIRNRGHVYSTAPGGQPIDYWQREGLQVTHMFGTQPLAYQHGDASWLQLGYYYDPDTGKAMEWECLGSVDAVRVFRVVLAAKHDHRAVIFEPLGAQDVRSPRVRELLKIEHPSYVPAQVKVTRVGAFLRYMKGNKQRVIPMGTLGDVKTSLVGMSRYGPGAKAVMNLAVLKARQALEPYNLEPEMKCQLVAHIAASAFNDVEEETRTFEDSRDAYRLVKHAKALNPTPRWYEYWQGWVLAHPGATLAGAFTAAASVFYAIIKLRQLCGWAGARMKELWARVSGDWIAQYLQTGSAMPFSQVIHMILLAPTYEEAIRYTWPIFWTVVVIILEAACDVGVSLATNGPWVKALVRRIPSSLMHVACCVCHLMDKPDHAWKLHVSWNILAVAVKLGTGDSPAMVQPGSFLGGASSLGSIVLKWLTAIEEPIADARVANFNQNEAPSPRGTLEARAVLYDPLRQPEADICVTAAHTMKPLAEDSSFKCRGEEECKQGFGAQAVGPVFDFITPKQFRKCSHNEMAAIRNRLLQATDQPTHYQEVRDMGRAVDEQYLDLQRPLKPVPFKAWLTRWAWPKRERMEKAKAQYIASGCPPLRRSQTASQTFIKREHHFSKLDLENLCLSMGVHLSEKARRGALLTEYELGGTDPRPIAGKKDLFQALTGPWTLAYSNRIKHAFNGVTCPILYAGRSADRVGELVHEFERKWGDTLFVYQGDSERYDVHVHAEERAEELVTYRRLGARKSFCARMFESKDAHGRTRYHIWYEAKAKRETGVGDTTACNTAGDAKKVLAALARLGVVVIVKFGRWWKISCRVPLLLVVMGDDFLLLLARAPCGVDLFETTMTKAFLQYGFRLGGKVTTLDLGEFCSAYFWRCRTGNTHASARCLAPKPGRLLAKLFWSRLYIPPKYQMAWCRAVAMSLRTTCNHVPVARVILQKVLELTSETRTHLPAAFRPKDTYKVRTSGALFHACSATFAQFEMIYGLTPSVVHDLEEWLDRHMTTLHVAFDHPALKRMVLVDYNLA